MFKEMVNVINEVRAARKYAAENGYNFAVFISSKELAAKLNEHVAVYNKYDHLIGRQWVFSTDDLKLHSLLHFFTIGVTAEWTDGFLPMMIYPVTRRDWKKLMR